MYNAEVLSKFPVVQHFPFGSLFSWDRDPNAVAPPTTVHATSGPQARPNVPDGGASSNTARSNVDAGTKAPWATAGSESRLPPMGPTAAPWAAARRDNLPGASPALGASRTAPGHMAPTRAPWAASQSSAPQPPPGPGGVPGPTKAPWAR